MADTANSASQAVGKTYSQAENPETLAGRLPEPRPRDCAAFLASCALQHEAEARLTKGVQADADGEGLLTSETDCCCAMIIQAHARSPAPLPIRNSLVSALHAIMPSELIDVRQTVEDADPVIDLGSDHGGSLCIFIRLLAGAVALFSNNGPEFTANLAVELRKHLQLREEDWRKILLGVLDPEIAKAAADGVNSARKTIKVLGERDEDWTEEKAFNPVRIDPNALSLAKRLANVTIDECGFVLAQFGALAHRATYDLCKGTNHEKGRGVLALRHCHLAAADAVRFAPSKARGHLDLLWVALEHGPDHALACKHARLALALADADEDDCAGAVSRYELAMAILFGGEGPMFKTERVVGFVMEARERVKRLARWGFGGLVGSSCAGDQVAEDFVTNVAAVSSESEYEAFGEPDKSTLPKKCGLCAASDKAVHQCDHCGLWFSKASLCSRCKAVRYCGRGCQSRAWAQGHKEECRKLANEAKLKAEASAKNLQEPEAEV